MMEPYQVPQYKLFEEIVEFLESCGGPYERVPVNTLRSIIWALTTGNYLWKPDAYFVCYKFIRWDDIDKVPTTDATALLDGDTLCVIDCGVKREWSTLYRFLVGITGGYAVWNRYEKGLKIFKCHKGKGGRYGKVSTVV